VIRISLLHILSITTVTGYLYIIPRYQHQPLSEPLSPAYSVISGVLETSYIIWQGEIPKRAMTFPKWYLWCVDTLFTPAERFLHVTTQHDLDLHPSCDPEFASMWCFFWSILQVSHMFWMDLVRRTLIGLSQIKLNINMVAKNAGQLHTSCIIANEMGDMHIVPNYWENNSRYNMHKQKSVWFAESLCLWSCDLKRGRAECIIIIRRSVSPENTVAASRLFSTSSSPIFFSSERLHLHLHQSLKRSSTIYNQPSQSFRIRYLSRLKIGKQQ